MSAESTYLEAVRREIGALALPTDAAIGLAELFADAERERRELEVELASRNGSSNGSRPAASAATSLAPVPPHNLEAEESVLGAMMLDGCPIAAVVANVDASDFYSEANSRVFTAAVDLHGRGDPVDFITLADELERRGQLGQIGRDGQPGKARLQELAGLVPAKGNAAHYARRVREARRRRDALALIREVEAAALNGSLDTQHDLLERWRTWLDTPAVSAATEPLRGRLHDEVLALDFPEERQLIRDLVPAGAVGTIAGVPETCKSWLAQRIAVRVARGTGTVLGCDVVGPGRVGYFWQDDSTREEAERIKLFHRVDETPSDLALWWFLNEGIELPRDLGRIRATVETLQLDLIALDSFYNFLPGIDLKDEGAEQIVALLKREIADATGCTVLIVDHMPWATDSNRQRLRAYGGVFKNAATRFGIYIDAVGKNLSIEARGNNIRGFSKRAAYWDPDTLELRLTEAIDHDENVARLADDLQAYLIKTPGSHSTTALAKVVQKRDDTVKEALEALKERAVVLDHGRDRGPWSGRNGSPRLWIACIHAASQGIQTTAELFGPWSAEVAAGAPEDEPRPGPSIRAVVGRAVVNPAEAERLAARIEETR